MLNLKKTAVAVLALGSSAVFAGTMGPVCAPGNVTIPCERMAWNVGAQALYVQPIYAVEGGSPQVVVNNSGTAASSNFAANYETPGLPYQWGFMVEASYHFGMGNDVNVNWYRVHNSNNLTSTTFQNTVAGATAGIHAQENTANTQWDQVDVELGQHIDFGDMKCLRLHGGVEYARIANQYDTQVNTLALDETAKSNYNGFGPRGGVDAKYHLGNGFAVYGKGAGSLLVGPSSYNNAALVNSAANGSAFGSHLLIVPELEGKLGFTYDYAMAQGDLTLDVGWMWINYFNAQQNALDGTYIVVPANNPVTPNTLRGRVSQTDFALQGLYFGGKWTGNV